jgi:hypothetical protein
MPAFFLFRVIEVSIGDWVLKHRELPRILLECNIKVSDFKTKAHEEGFRMNSSDDLVEANRFFS